MNNNKKKSIHNNFRRENYIGEIEGNSPDFDFLVIGGGATGLGIAVDAATRGYKTLLLEQADFAKGTSSRSTKLIHGGVRYLAQGNVRLVYEALYERGLLLKNAPHLVRMQPFVIPNFTWWNQIVYSVGLKIYDWMAWRYRFPKTAWLPNDTVKNLLPNLKRSDLKGGVLYYDGQFDDARLALNLAQTCASHGGMLINYMKVKNLVKDASGKVRGVRAKDLETGNEYTLKASAVINATGVFVDEVLQMNASSEKPIVRPSQGVHIVLDSCFLQGNNALMIPATSDGRVLFAVPWHNHVLAGTTDTPLEKHSLEPVPLEDEISFILETLGQYLIKKPTRKDVLSVFAGLRPLAAQENHNDETKEISRGHKLFTTQSGLITITGGKWTTYRKMAEDTVDEAIKVAHLKKRSCVTSSLKIYGYSAERSNNDHLSIYGSDARFIRALANERPDLNQLLHPSFPHIHAEVIWAVRSEMARTVEDILARRLRILFLNANAAIEMAPQVAALMASELEFDYEWQRTQIDHFTSLAGNYLLEPKHHFAIR